MKKDILKVRDVVEKVLSGDLRARDDDKWLTLRVLREMGFSIYIPYREMGRMPSFESIRRTRQKFQAQGLFLASGETKSSRISEETEMDSLNKWFQ